MRIRLASAAAGLMAAAGAAAAQPPGPPGGAVVQRPALSPYLNLLRPNTLPAINYYGLVRPQQQFQSAVQSLQAETAALGAMTAAGPADQPPLVTGVPFGFQNAGGYFQNQFRVGTPGTPPFFGSQGVPGRPAGRPTTAGRR